MKLSIWPVLQIELNADGTVQHDNTEASKEILLKMSKAEKQIW